LLRFQVAEDIRGNVRDDDEGDALDSVIAAGATFRAVRALGDSPEPETASVLEGKVYV
jgi:hypothetical protein